jgi:hypothetical protein
MSEPDEGGPSEPSGSAPDASQLPPAGATPSLREDQVQNAVAFLSHPKVGLRRAEFARLFRAAIMFTGPAEAIPWPATVCCRRPPPSAVAGPLLGFVLLTVTLACLQVRSSPVASKREFLQRKGLIEAEIDEAFRRVPEAPAAAAPAPSPAPAAMQATLQHLQPQAAQLQHQQLPPVYAGGAAGPQSSTTLHQAPPQQPGVRWTQVSATCASACHQIPAAAAPSPWPARK